MKFGKQIRFVAVKAWFDHYVNYKQFKKSIIQGTSRLNEAHENGATDEEVEDLKSKFVESFSHDLYKAINIVTAFYVDEYVRCEKLIDEITVDLNEHLEFSNRDNDVQRSFTKRVFGCTLTAYELRTFLEINRTAAQKIVKKLKKNIGENALSLDYQETELEHFGNLPAVEALMKQLEDQYVVVRRDLGLETDSRARPEICLELHNKVDSSLAWKQSTVLTNFNAIDFRRSEISVVSQPIKVIPLIIATCVLIALVCAQFTPSLSFTAQRTIGIIGFCAILWATGAVPLWLTSLSVPLLAVVFKVIPNIDYKSFGKLIEQSTMSATVFLTMGGFTIAAALQATEMDKRIATIILKKASSNKAIFLLVCSLLNAFIAMWISNITSTMIVVTLVQPTLRQIPTNSNYAKAVVFSIAVGGNLGGMITPLSSPQNAVTIEAVTNAVLANPGTKGSLSFTEFFATALPFAVICALIAWGILLLKYPIDIERVPAVPDVKTDFGWRQITVSIISVAVIVVWVTLPFGADKVFSDYGIVGFLPLLIFYGIGILPPSKVAELPWNIIFLLMGGNALSKIVQESGLMQVVSDLMTDLLGGTSLWVTILIVNICVLVIDFFLTHTVSSMITMPLVANFAAKSSPNHIVLFAMAGCMTTTASQILPVSSFPNMCCVSLTDDAKKEYVKPADMIKWGIMITCIFLACVMSVYYGIGLAYGMFFKKGLSFNEIINFDDVDTIPEKIFNKTEYENFINCVIDIFFDFSKKVALIRDRAEDLSSILLSDLLKIHFVNQDLVFWAKKAYNSNIYAGSTFSKFLKEYIEFGDINLEVLFEIVNIDGPKYSSLTLTQVLNIFHVDRAVYKEIGYYIKSLENEMINANTFFGLIINIKNVIESAYKSTNYTRLQKFGEGLSNVLLGKETNNKDVKLITNIFTTIMSSFTLMTDGELGIAANAVVSNKANIRALKALKNRLKNMDLKTPRLPPPTHRNRFIRKTPRRTPMPTMSPPPTISPEPTPTPKPTTSVSPTMSPYPTPHPTKTRRPRRTAPNQAQQKVEQKENAEMKKLGGIIDSYYQSFISKIPLLPLKKKVETKYEFNQSWGMSDELFVYEADKSSARAMFDRNRKIYQRPKIVHENYNESERENNNIQYLPFDPEKKYKTKDEQIILTNYRLSEAYEQSEPVLSRWRIEMEARFMDIFVHKSLRKAAPLQDFIINFTLQDDEEMLDNFRKAIVRGDTFFKTLKTLCQNKNNTLCRIIEELSCHESAHIDIRNEGEPKTLLGQSYNGYVPNRNVGYHISQILKNTTFQNVPFFVLFRIPEGHINESKAANTLKSHLHNITNQEYLDDLKELSKEGKIKMNDILYNFGYDYSVGDYASTLQAIVSSFEPFKSTDTPKLTEWLHNLNRGASWAYANQGSALTPNFATLAVEDGDMFLLLFDELFDANSTLDSVLSVFSNGLLNLGNTIQRYENKTGMPSIVRLLRQYNHKKNKKRFYIPILNYLYNVILLKSSGTVTYKEIFLSEVAVIFDELIDSLSKVTFLQVMEWFCGRDNANEIVSILNAITGTLFI